LDKPQDVVFDSGTGQVWMPKSNGKDIIKKLLDDVKHFTWFGTTYLSCNTDLYMSLFILIDGYYFEIHPTTFILPYKTTTSGKYSCKLGLKRHSESYWILGDVFLRSYYSLFDSSAGTLKLAPRATGPFLTISAGSSVSRRLSSPMEEELIL
jgi:cathepsin D